MEDKVVRGVPWTLLAYAGSKAIGVLTTLVVAHLLVPKDFGIMAIALMATSFVSWFGDLGFSRTLVLRQDLDRDGEGTLLSLMLMSSVAAAGVSAALGPLAALAFHEPRLTAVLGVLSLVLIPGGLGSYYEALLEREFEFRRRFVGYGLQAVVSAAVSIALAVAGAGVWSLVAGQLAGYGVFALTLFALAPYRVRPRFDRSLTRGLFGSGMGFLSQGVTDFLRVNADNITVARVFGSSALGYYSMAFRFGDLSWTAIAAPATRVSFSAFTRARHRGDDICPAVLSSLRLVALVAIPFGLLLSGTAEPMTRALLGSRWLPMVGPLTILGLWAAIRPLDSLLCWVLNSVGLAKLVSFVSVGVLALLVPALIVAVQFGRLSAVALMVTGDITLSLALSTFFVHRRLGLAVRAIWNAVRPSALAGPPMWLATWAVAHALPKHDAAIAFPAAVVAGLAVYAAVISLVDRRLLPSAGSQALRMLGRARAAA